MGGYESSCSNGGHDNFVGGLHSTLSKRCSPSLAAAAAKCVAVSISVCVLLCYSLLQRQVVAATEGGRGEEDAVAFCSKCGNEVTAGAGFCPKCGQQVSAPGTTQPAAQPRAPGTTQPAAQPGASGTPQPTAQAGAGGGQMSNNVAGLLCYVLIPITGILFLVLEPYNRDPFVRFHAFQSIFFLAATIVLIIADWSAERCVVRNSRFGVGSGVGPVLGSSVGAHGPLGGVDGPGLSKQEVEASRDRRPSRKASLRR